ncbi:unnamed protein product [Rotaria magnacalcarata]|uniref:lysoplasmalogenase n=1 Tax=Rotaria magnacalcarata TaxID=392030 RepID=A0A819A8P3_9BILA|nr:unnamed protein product [Rotaria magnacalcarata]CAF1433286.1 unnamed protein product [Rotaria magnacalcarata]CAF1946155.1 unnamed protein product [Rotaria magnacalcarata]CAF2095786.1 unnamed protein product [Rotaria magnacalcarata]CAF2138159.1 unnamed protein product [Rotaria magnacalcarata]
MSMTKSTILGQTNILTKLPNVIKCNGPKLVPFFKTVAIFFILFPKSKYKTADVFYLTFKCLPICSLILFILLNGINLRGFEYSYSRRILTGLAFSLLGDALLVYDHSFFIHGILAFGISHILYASAYGMRPLRGFMLPFMFLPLIVIYLMLSGVLYKPLSYVIYAYIFLTMFMIWRAMARIKIDNNEWTWTRFYSFIGGILFATSDALLALDRFVTPLVHSQILVMTTYYAAQLLIALSVVDSHEDVEMNFCVIQETDIIKAIQENGKLLSQMHRDDLIALLSAKHAYIKQTVANTQIKTRFMEKTVQIGQNIDLFLSRTPVMLLVKPAEQKD